MTGNRVPAPVLDPGLKKYAAPSPSAGTPVSVEKMIRKMARGSLHHALNQVKLLRLRREGGRPRLGIYDHALHFIGGAQKYGLTLAAALADRFDITLMASKPVSLTDLSSWYNLDLSPCRVKIIPLPFFNRIDDTFIDPARITGREVSNPFHAVSRESARYDIFVNNSMCEMVYPLSLYSLLVCHFPERRPGRFFYPDLYHQTIYNSRYTGQWIEKRWGYKPHTHVYPPVHMPPATDRSRKNRILSVARFEVEGTKKQLEMLRAFHLLRRENPRRTRDWELVLVGGSAPENDYLMKIRDYIRRHRLEGIRILTNAPDEVLRKEYASARVFWHLCGIGEDHPARVEHFGMTIVEAMQNGLVPLVYDGGGQREIVDNGINGIRIRTIPELVRHTASLIQRPAERHRLSAGAREKSRVYSEDRFRERVRRVFGVILSKLAGP